MGKYILRQKPSRARSTLEHRSMAKLEDVMVLKNRNLLDIDNQNNYTLTYPMKNRPLKSLTLTLVPLYENFENNAWISRSNRAQNNVSPPNKHDEDLNSKRTIKYSESKDNRSPSEETLKKVAKDLCKELTKILIQKPDYHLYREDIVFENRIHNKVVTGALNYVQQIGLLRIYAHLRFVFVQLQKGVRIEKEEGI